MGRARACPSTFFPEIDESMERVYVRFAPGTSLEDASAKTVDDGRRRCREKLPEGSVKLVLTNVGSPSKARSAMTSPNMGHAHGLHPSWSSPSPSKRSLDRSASSPIACASSSTHTIRASSSCRGRAGSSRACSRTATSRPLVVEVRGDDLDGCSTQSKAVAEVARTVPGIRDVYVQLEIDYPEIRVDTDREKAGLVGVTARDAAQTTLEATLGNINTPERVDRRRQRPVLLRRHVLRRRAS